MRRLVWAVILLGSLTSIWWVVAAKLWSQSLSHWFDHQRNRGWLAEYTSLDTTGFPTRHVTRIAAPALADPGTGAAWQAEALTLDSPAIWPGDLRVHFADGPQRLAWLDRRAALQTTDMVAQLSLRPGTSLSLRALGLTSGPWALSDDQGVAAMSAQGLTLAMNATDIPERYSLELAAPGFLPGDTLRRIVRAAPALPQRFNRLEVAADVTFDTPWDRRALEHRRPQPRILHLRRADAWWGNLRVSAAGKLDIDAAGIPTGTLELRAENWRDMLRMAEQSGALPASAAGSAERLLSFLAGLGGAPDILEAQINFRGGVMALGPIPIAPAPRLILR